ncbi:MAG TPA: hypothetical protein VL307_18085 [Chitinophagaceae bacterium]|nr:hypothetical protein [Chitinophagaceae bacterium]
MNKMKQLAALLPMAALLICSCSKDDDYNEPPAPAVISTVVKASGDITAALTQFRSILGDSLNTTPGKTSGRREVNWDGVPAANTNNNSFPLDFFNLTDPNGAAGRKRGLVYATGTSIRIDSSDFSELEPSNAAEFDAFSNKKILAPVGTNLTTALFKVPGTNTDASIKGFGVVFIDVDDANATSIEFFSGSKSLGVFKAPVRTSSSFSFLGVYFPNEKVTRVQITTGNAAIATGTKDISAGGSKDLVAMDDFFYDEPKQAGN